MTTFIGQDGLPLRVCGYGGVFGTVWQGVRLGDRPFVLNGQDVVLTINHCGEHVQLASMREGTLELWQDLHGLAFAADVPLNQRGWWILHYLATNPRCSYYGYEKKRRAPDGVEEIHNVELLDVSLCADPFFDGPCAWRSDSDWRDLTADIRHYYHLWGNRGRREPLPSLYAPAAANRTTASRRPADLSPHDAIFAGMDRRFVRSLCDLAKHQRYVASMLERQR